MEAVKTEEKKPLRPDEVLLSAWVDTKDCLEKISTKKLFEEILNRSDEDIAQIMLKVNTPFLNNFENKLKKGYRKQFDDERAEEDEDTKYTCDLHHMEFESLQHQMLFESFEEAREKHPIKLGEVLDNFVKKKL